MTEFTPTGINYLDFLANAGWDLDGDVGQQVETAPVERLQEFRERYLDLLEVFQKQMGFTPVNRSDRAHLLEIGKTKSGRIFDCPSAEKGEFRPILHGRILRTGKTMLGGDQGSDFDTLNLEARLRRVKALLVYAHSIVVPDSLFYINQFFGRGDETYAQYFDSSRQQLRNYLTLISKLKPLIRSSTILFYPQFEHGSVGFGGHDGFADPEYEKWDGGPEADLSAQDILTVRAGHKHLNEIFFMANRYDATAMADRRYALPMKYLVRSTARPVRKDHERDKYLAWNLASVDLPELDQLPLDDIVALRRNSEHFAQWRGLLADAVDKIDNFSELPPESALREVQEILREGQNNVGKQMREVSAWRQAVEGAKTFGFTVGGALIATAATGDAATAGATGLLTFLGQYVAGSSARKSRRALKAHFAAFTGEGL